MKILLISSNVASTPYSVYPLGMGMVARALQQAGYEVYQYDYLHAGMSPEHLGKVVSNISPELVGISIRNIDNVNMLHEVRYIEAVQSIVRTIRDHSPAPVVLGGSGFSIMPKTILEAVGADYGISGEGEEGVVELADAIVAGRAPAKGCRRAPNTLRGAGIPAALYDPDLMRFYLEKGGIATIQTKRGCPHKCVYCTYPVIEGPVYRPRDPRKVVDDMEHLKNKFQARHIFFTDSVFNDDQGHFMEIVAEMDRRGLTMPWTAFFKPTGLTDEQAALMKKTGLVGAEIGADAITDRTLKEMGKSFRVGDIKTCNALFNRHGIATAHFYMFGGPGETRETIKEGIETVINMTDTVSFMYMGIRILPHTLLAERAVREGLIAAEGSLLEPVYYLAPGLERNWLEKRLTRAFRRQRHCVFPADKLDSSLQFLHKLGYQGSLWEMLIPGYETDSPPVKLEKKAT